MRNDELNQINNVETAPIPPHYIASATIRARILELFVLFSICAISMYLYKQVPLKGYWLNELLGLSNSNWLHINISYKTLIYPLRFLGITSLLIAIYVILQQLTTKYTIYDLVFEKTYGVFNRVSDPIDFIKIKDVRKTRSFWEIILGLGSMTIYSPSDTTNPELRIKGLSKQDIEYMFTYLRDNSINNITEYKIKQDLKNQRLKKNRKNDTSIYDDGNGYED